jgi:hypothetical protein
MTAKMTEQLAAAEAERDRVTDGVRYWCYCMSEAIGIPWPVAVQRSDMEDRTFTERYFTRR